MARNIEQGKEVCYDPIRCFSDSQPWASTTIRPLNLLPWSPEKIGTRFGLYTNENANNFQILLPSGPSTTEASNFQTDRKTRFITHGFVDKGEHVQGGGGELHLCGLEERLPDHQHAGVRVVGAQLAWMLATLQSNYTYSPTQVHLIGHSLGARMLGEAGSRTPSLGRITGGIIKPGSTHFSEFDADLHVGTIEKVKFLWNNNAVNSTLPKVGAAKITMQKGEDKTEYVSLVACA
ncbi:hypothetical protein CB1_000678011 [Camelus ferus]|nr:hypothetical protein CB1_000678011 [Camelus ferus]